MFTKTKLNYVKKLFVWTVFLAVMAAMAFGQGDKGATLISVEDTAASAKLVEGDEQKQLVEIENMKKHY